jgi:hypothetical protein
LWGDTTMKRLLTLFNRPGRPAGSRFDRYYGDVIRSGVGYPTADEARRDLASHNRTLIRHGWMR